MHLYASWCVENRAAFLDSGENSSAGLLAGCCVDLPVHAELFTYRKNAFSLEPRIRVGVNIRLSI
jgi:hypothetical protein